MIKPTTFILLLLFAFFTLGMNIYTDTFLGGQGMIQTFNTITTIEIICLVSVVFLLLSLNKKIFVSPLLSGFFLLSIIIIFSSWFNINQKWDVALSVGCIGLLAICIFIVQQLSKFEVELLLWIILIATSTQALVGLSFAYKLTINQEWFNHPFAIFKQRNVYASFLVSGLVVSVILWIKYPNNILRSAALTLFMSILMYAIYFVRGSRTALLSLIVIGVLLVFYICVNWYSKEPLVKQKNNTLLKWLPIFFGLVPILIALSVSVTNNDHDKPLQEQVNIAIDRSPDKIVGASAQARIAIYSITWDLVKRKVWTGHGYGSFTRAYEYHLSESGIIKDYVGGSQLKHPHNIILYVWVEGGVAPVVLLFALAGAIANVLIMSGREGLLWLAVLTPISLHLLTEAPFSMSVPHILLFGLLLGGATYQTRRRLKNKHSKVAVPAVALVFILVVAPYAIMFGFTYNNLLTYSTKLAVHLQRSSDFLIDKSVFEGPLRYRFDQLRAERAFQIATQTKKTSDYLRYISQAEPLVPFLPGKNLLANLALSYALVGNENQGRKYFNHLALYYPNKLNWFSLIRYYGDPTPTPLNLKE